MRLTAKSSRGFSGPGGLTASLMRFVKGSSSRLLSHFLANLSDNLITSATVTCGKMNYTLLIWLKYGCIYVELYTVAESPLSFNYKR